MKADSLTRTVQVTTTIFLANMPRMLEDIVQTVLKRSPGFRVARQGGTTGDLLGAAAASGASAIMLAVPDPRAPFTNDPRLALLDNLVVLALSESGAEAWLYRLSCDGQPLPETSSDALLDALSTARRV
jgi:hypothetical protein